MGGAGERSTDAPPQSPPPAAAGAQTGGRSSPARMRTPLGRPPGAEPARRKLETGTSGQPEESRLPGFLRGRERGGPGGAAAATTLRRAQVVFARRARRPVVPPAARPGPLRAGRRVERMRWGKPTAIPAKRPGGRGAPEEGSPRPALLRGCTLRQATPVQFRDPEGRRRKWGHAGVPGGGWG